ncbi:MAG: Gfo/Idh/MocA family oxidoreductase [Eubacteriales bacterium]|nr:Gfo/Idh/MocA family oxidoreductase [Eubacteriales bacterium]
MGLKIGIVGAGGFSNGFAQLFKTHPLVEKVAIAELIPERRAEYAKRHGITEEYESLDEMLKSDADCVAIFTQRHLHGPMVIKALKAGKHVYSAVPVATEVEEIHEIVELVNRTRLIYMVGETCYYWPCAMFCREMYKSGRMGDFVYGEAQYYHDMKRFYLPFQRSGGENWKMVAGLPPMHYPTHSTGMILSALEDAYAVKVSCMGYRDNHSDGIFGEGKNYWDNPYSNETAIMKLSNGGICRINEYRRIGWERPSSYISGMYGTRGGYENSSMQHIWQEDPEGGKPVLTDVSDRLNTVEYVRDSKREGFSMEKNALNYKAYHSTFSAIQNFSRLPQNDTYLKLSTGHSGSHPFLVDDFVKAVAWYKLPPNNIWDAARYNIPGLIAHKSAMKDGALMEVPDFGGIPGGWTMLEPDKTETV